MAASTIDREKVRRALPARSMQTARTIAAGFAPLLLLYSLYTLLRWTFADRASSVGDHNAVTILNLEQDFGIAWERTVQTHVLRYDALTWLFNHYYVYAFFPVLVASAVLAALRASAAFQHWRSIFILSLAVALAGFALFPLTPPRLMPPEYGYVDSLMLHGPRYYGDESGSSLFNAYGSIPSMVNEYAAMPSMHVGWSAIAVALLIAAFPAWKRWLLFLGIGHVAMMELAVVATGNHYLVDGLVGLVVVALAWLAVDRVTPRLRAMTTRTGSASPRVPAHGD
jgi:hypothetical protein